MQFSWFSYPIFCVMSALVFHTNVFSFHNTFFSWCVCLPSSLYSILVLYLVVFAFFSNINIQYIYVNVDVNFKNIFMPCRFCTRLFFFVLLACMRAYAYWKKMSCDWFYDFRFLHQYCEHCAIFLVLLTSYMALICYLSSWESCAFYSTRLSCCIFACMKFKIHCKRNYV